jgi:hypothetical protein
MYNVVIKEHITGSFSVLLCGKNKKYLHRSLTMREALVEGISESTKRKLAIVLDLRG